MLGLALAALAGLAIGIAIYTLFQQNKVSAYARANEQNDSYVAERVHGWYDRWDARYRAAGFEPRSETFAGNLAVGIVMVVFPMFFFTLGIAPAVGVAGGAAYGYWAYLGSKGRKRSKELDPVINDFVGALADKVAFMSPREAFIVSVDDSSEVLIAKIFGPAVAELNAGAPLSRVLPRIVRETPNEAVAEMCAELEASDREGSRNTANTLNRLRDGLIERDIQRREAMAGDTLIKVMKNLFVFAPLVALGFSLLIAGPAWNNPVGFILMGFIVGGTLGANALFKRMLNWRMDY